MNVYTLVAFVALCLLARLTNVTSIMCGRSNTAFTTTSHDREQEILASEKDVFPDDPYMNYLLWPHLHFSGTYIADVSTINNDPQNYNTEKVIPTNLDESSNNWNPKGTGEWSVNGVVTQICYPDGNCIDSDDEKSRGEPLVGALVFDGGNKSAAKLTDLDTEARLFSEIWGWRLRFGNFFSADYSPVPFQYMWKKMVNDPRLSHTYGGAYQSVLSNIRWIQNNNSGSPFLTKLQKSMESKNIDSSRLSIRLTMDMYQNDSTKNSFTTGRITGTIGLLGIKSPPFFTHGRMMRALSDQVQDAPFYVDKINKKVAVDFGNSLPIDEDGNMDTILKNKLLVAVHLDNNDHTKCSDNLIKLGVVLNKDANWYETSAGVQIFPDQGSLSDDAMSKLADHPLVVAEVNGNDCQRILLAEAQDGLVVHPYSKWTLREEPNETAHVQLLVTKFGNPLQNANIKFEPCNCEIIFSGPKVGLPPLPVERPEIMTNIDGIATFNINTKDPKNNRSFIDGQLYPFFYSLKGKDDTCDSLCVPDLAVFLKLLNKLIVIRVFDNYKQKGKEATWLDDVYPIFKQYANLYPVMTDNFVDLGNYHEVVMYRRAIQGSLMLPIHHPNHMPASRDLSASKRQVIVKWLSNDSPAKGNPEHYYSVEHLRQDLQNALELEHSTIPPYLTALASIKFSYNLEVQGILKEIIIQEMMHMALVANILNAIGGQPSLYSKEFIPRYPSRLPGGVQPDLIVPIEKVSLGLIRNIFMKIEQPELEKGRVSSLRHTFAYAELLKIKQETQCHKDEKGEMCIDTGHKPVFPLVNIQTDHSVDDELSACFISPPEEKPSTDSTKQKEEDDKMLEKRKLWKNFLSASGAIVKHNNTIGGFYNHILNALGNLTGCGKHNDIFTGNRSRQVNVKHWSMKGHSLEVYDYITAVDAIKTIVEQGEGSSPCNPVAWNTEAGKSLSHYFLFRSVAEKREIRVWNKTKHKRSSGSDEDGTVLDYSELCNGTYHFIGPKIPFDPNGVWPIISNPTMARYSRDSKAHRQAKRFNQVYTKLLKSLDNVFNGQPDTLKDALGLMYSVDLHLKKLVHTPIADDGDPEVGPNAAPTFDFTP